VPGVVFEISDTNLLGRSEIPQIAQALLTPCRWMVFPSTIDFRRKSFEDGAF
jgi:hypothetical protein